MTDWIADEKKYLFQNYGRQPIVIERGEGTRCWDTEGREYLDFVGGLAVNVLGHAHPVVADAIAEQARTLIHTSNLYYTQPMVELAKILDEAWMLVRIDREAAGVELHSLAPEGLTVLADPDRLGQVFVNLLRNAADAMDGAGTITVRAEPVERDGRRWVSIRIQDEGPGIAPDVLSRLFEPFVSTRLDARGTGLGLAVSEGIIREHGGRVEVDSAAGRGTTFIITLPDPTPDQ